MHTIKKQPLNQQQSSSRDEINKDLKKPANSIIRDRKITDTSRSVVSDNNTTNLSWISELSKQVVSGDLRSSSSNRQNDIAVSKKERIQRRDAKKRRREERIALGSKGTSQESLRKKKANDTATNDKVHNNRTKSKEYSIRRLKHLQEVLQNIVSRFEEEYRNQNAKSLSPYISQDVKGKATSGQKLTDDNIQPRKSDYGGLGFARKSLLISLRDISFVPKLEQEFAEHVHGFFGKQRTKAMKKQLDGNMLWRRLQQEKNSTRQSSTSKQNHDLNHIKWNGKKLSDMTPDERVEAMIKLNMI